MYAKHYEVLHINLYGEVDGLQHGKGMPSFGNENLLCPPLHAHYYGFNPKIGPERQGRTSPVCSCSTGTDCTSRL